MYIVFIHIQGKSIVQLMPKAFVSTIRLKKINKNKNILCLNFIHDLMFLFCVYICECNVFVLYDTQIGV